MPTPVQLKRNGTPGASAPSSLLHGELALNYGDARIFWRDASNVIQSFTFQSYALSSHTHAASDITSGTLDIARIPTGSSSSTVCIGNDSRLSDTRTPTDNTVSTAKIQNDAVTYAKIQNVSATDRLLGRSSSGAGDVEEITCTSFGRSLISSADAAAARTTLSVQPTASPAFTGAAAFANTGNVVPLTVNNSGTSNSFVVNDDGSGDTTPFVIDADGNAGIGYSTPSDYGKLVVSGGTAANAPVVTIESTAFNASQGCSLDFARAGFTQKVQARLATQDNGASASNFIIYTKADGTAGALSARLTISSTGTATFAGQIVGQAGAAISGGAVTVTSPLRLTGTVAGNNRMLEWQTSGTTRWQVSAHFNAESGSNAGSDLYVSRWSDSGVFLGTPLQIRRDTGMVTCESGLTVQNSPVTVIGGSVSTCSVAPSGDPNTGLYFPAANVAAVVTDGVERVRVDASGRVGIGVAPGSTSPYALTVYRGSVDSVIMAQGLLTDSPFNGTGKSAVQLDVDGKGGFAWQNDASGGTRTLKLLSNSGYGAGDSTLMTVSSGGTITASQVYSDTVGATNRDLFVDSTGKFGYVSSIRESKTDIVTLDDVSWLSALSPVSYRYRKKNSDGTYSDEADGVTDYGLIAEDVEAVRPELCFYDQVDGEPQLRGVTYSKLITPMLRYIQQLEARIAALEERLNG
jgi:hypothetical protein